jgi:hypothetical protein
MYSVGFRDWSTGESEAVHIELVNERDWINLRGYYVRISEKGQTAVNYTKPHHSSVKLASNISTQFAI